MSFLITMVESKDGVEVRREELPLTFAFKLEAWEAACDRARTGAPWGIGEDMGFIWVRDDRHETQYHVHAVGEGPRPAIPERETLDRETLDRETLDREREVATGVLKAVLTRD